MSHRSTSRGALPTGVKSYPHRVDTLQPLIAFCAHGCFRSVLAKTLADATRLYSRMCVYTSRHAATDVTKHLSARTASAYMVDATRVAPVVPHFAVGIDTISERIALGRTRGATGTWCVRDVGPHGSHAFQRGSARGRTEGKTTTRCTLSALQRRACFNAPALVRGWHVHGTAGYRRTGGTGGLRGARAWILSVDHVRVALAGAGDVDTRALLRQAVCATLVAIGARCLPRAHAGARGFAPCVTGTPHACTRRGTD